MYKEWQRVRVIPKARLQSFWETPGHEDSEGPLRAWYTHVNHRSVSWQSWGDVKADYGSASLVGNCVVFNIGGNKFRLVVVIHFNRGKVYVRHVMTHEQYDAGRWKGEC